MTVVPRFMFPPHPSPSLKITPEMLNFHENQGAWIAQRKFNGAHSVIWIYQDQMEMWNRRGDPFSTYRITDNMKKCFLHNLNRDYNTEYVLNGELLHTKAKSAITNKQAAENVIVLFDILYAGSYLTSMTTLERLAFLETIAPSKGLEPKKRAFSVCEEGESQLWLAETFHDEFSYHFWEMYEFDKYGNDKYPEIEGLMLKQKEAKNTSLGNRPNDVQWMLRCRKTKTKLYQF
jgi:ATP-dependent DNA ligase